MKAVAGKLTYSNVMVTILAFVVLAGGTAYAASHLGKNSVGTKQLRRNAVTAAKIKKGAVTGAKVKSGSLTGAQIDASTLGTVPSALRAAAVSAARTLARAGIPRAAGAGKRLERRSVDEFRPGRVHEGPLRLRPSPGPRHWRPGRRQPLPSAGGVQARRGPVASVRGTVLVPRYRVHQDQRFRQRRSERRSLRRSPEPLARRHHLSGRILSGGWVREWGSRRAPSWWRRSRHRRRCRRRRSSYTVSRSAGGRSSR